METVSKRYDSAVSSQTKIKKKCKKPLDNQKQICYNKYINQKGIDTNDY